MAQNKTGSAVEKTEQGDKRADQLKGNVKPDANSPNATPKPADTQPGQQGQQPQAPKE